MAKTTKGYSGSNQQRSNNMGNLPQPQFGNQSKYQTTPSAKSVSARKSIKK